MFSGRYKALLVEARSPGYLKTVCDYVHLNPVRARLLGADERSLSYLWSSFAWYLAAPAHRLDWIRVDRLLGEHGIAADTADGRIPCAARRVNMWVTPLGGIYARFFVLTSRNSTPAFLSA